MKAVYLSRLDVDRLDTVGATATSQHCVSVTELGTVQELSMLSSREWDIFNQGPFTAVPQLQCISTHPWTCQHLTILLAKQKYTKIQITGRNTPISFRILQWMQAVYLHAFMLRTSHVSRNFKPPCMYACFPSLPSLLRLCTLQYYHLVNNHHITWTTGRSAVPPGEYNRTHPLTLMSRPSPHTWGPGILRVTPDSVRVSQIWNRCAILSECSSIVSEGISQKIITSSKHLEVIVPAPRHKNIVVIWMVSQSKDPLRVARLLSASGIVAFIPCYLLSYTYAQNKYRLQFHAVLPGPVCLPANSTATTHKAWR